MSFADLKKNRKSMIEKLIDAGEKAQGGNTNQTDDKIWTPTVDKAGNGYAVIRFLPSKDSSSLPWAQYYDHGFKGPTGRWYIEKSLTTIGKDDPASQINSWYWNKGDDDNRAIARKQKRRLHYISNIYIVSDPGAPENEGKVFLYRYGKKIFEKIMDVMQPQFEDETPINPFDFWDGADFKLKIRQVEGYRNYDKSEFAEPSAFFDGDEDQLKALFEKLYDFTEWTDPKNYKSYTELYRKLSEVLGSDVVETAIGGANIESTAESKIKLPSKEKKEEPVKVDDDDDLDYSMDSSTDDDDEMTNFFQKLAEEE